MATLFLSSLLNAAEQTGLIQTRERQTDKKDEIHKKLGIDLLQIDFKFGFKQLQLKLSHSFNEHIKIHFLV